MEVDKEKGIHGKLTEERNHDKALDYAVKKRNTYQKRYEALRGIRRGGDPSAIEFEMAKKTDKWHKKAVKSEQEFHKKAAEDDILKLKKEFQ